MDQNNEAAEEQKFECEQFQNSKKMKMRKKQLRNDLPVDERKILQDNKTEDQVKNRIEFAKLIFSHFIFTNSISLAYLE